MKIAYAHWNGRIAPVFDSAQQVLVVDTENGNTASEQQHTLSETGPFQKGAQLADLGVQTLVCGAISRPLHEWLLARGINVVAFVAGELREVMQAWQNGTLESSAFAMPGCGRRMRGMGRGMGAGMGRGLSAGRGMGGGMGRGMGVGRGMGTGMGINTSQGTGVGIGRGMGFGGGASIGLGRGIGRNRNNQS